MNRADEKQAERKEREYERSLKRQEQTNTVRARQQLSKERGGQSSTQIQKLERRILQLEANQDYLIRVLRANGLVPAVEVE